MLNYYEIDMGGKRSEKMTAEQKKLFLDRFNRLYDSEIIRDIIKKISDNIKNNPEQNNEDNTDFDSNQDDFDLFGEDLFSEDDGKLPNSNKKVPDNNKNDDAQYLKEINTFLGWLYGVLIQSRYNVIITDDGGVTSIQLIKLKKGGSKK